MAINGKVLQSTGSWYLVKSAEGEKINCRIKGKFRMGNMDFTNPVAVGDLVEIEKEPNSDTAVIVRILPRHNYVVRESPRKKYARHVLAANMDQALIVVTLIHPNLKQGFLDRFLIACEAYHVTPVIVFNKTDLVTQKKHKDKLTEVTLSYELIGYKVIHVSAITRTNLENLKEIMAGKTSLVSGHSGVGKSTLVNLLHPDLNLKVGDISGHTGKGVHTTTFATMYELPFGGYIVDTPGIKELSLMDVEPEELSHYLPEMRNLLDKCHYSNCLHVNEPDCAVKEALENGEIDPNRYFNYLGILDELQNRKSWEYTQRDK